MDASNISCSITEVKDISGDGDFNIDDKKIIGDPNPDFIYGLNSSLTYKNFDFTIFLQGVYGADIFNFNKSQHANSFNFGVNQIKEVQNAWTAESPNPNAPYPEISLSSTFQASDRFVEDGSYLRIKNIRVGYTVPIANIKWMTNLQVYLSAQNLLTFTKYSWYDPEINTRGGDISKGIDQFGYPVPRIFTAGFKVGL